MYACQLDMLHNTGNEAVCSVRDSVSLALCSVVEEAVDEDGSVRSYADSSIHVNSHHLVIVNDLHSASAENVGRTNHNRIADLVCDSDSLVSVYSHACLRHRNAQLVHHSAEVVSVLSKVDGLRSCTEDIYAVLLQVVCKVERSLSAELSDNANGLFLLVDSENVLKSKGLEIELIRCIIVSRNCLGVAVYDNGLKAQLLQSKCSVNAAVVEFDTLTNSVGTAAKDHDLWLFGAYGALVLVKVIC